MTYNVFGEKLNLTWPVQPDSTIVNDHHDYCNNYQSVPIM